MKSWLAHHLRRIADRIDDAGAPRRTNLSFTFENKRGIVVRENGPGCPLWYYGEADYRCRLGGRDSPVRPMTITEEIH